MKCLITIKDIAELAKVSRTTVSRVLNNSGYVSEKARIAVQQVIEETGYVPSQHAKAMRTKKTKVIGVILPKISTDTSSRTVNGMNEIFANKGYQILLANTNLDKEKEIEYLKLLQSRQVDGIILLATNTDGNLLNEIKSMKIPVVLVGQEFPDIPSITFDDYGAARSLTELMVKKGNRNIAFIGVDEADRAVGFLRKKGYLDVMREHQLLMEKSWIQVGDFSIESGYEAMKRIMDSSSVRPDAVFAATDRMALGVWKFIKEQGWKIPTDISVTGIGSSETSKFIDPALTTIEYRNEMAGIEAAKLMLQLLKSEKPNFNKLVLDFRLIERDSL
ncbi:LacI family DNA-binding transcriptional regulator [Lederbergia lenta]|uniref:LacI family DNA-binding transcriptional regulator n=1 Tax=Lederbergia lenta TaxID=1467 RepID=UPI0032E7FAC1